MKDSEADLLIREMRTDIKQLLSDVAVLKSQEIRRVRHTEICMPIAISTLIGAISYLFNRVF